MNLALHRYQFIEDGIFGNLVSPDNVVATVLEHAYKVGQVYRPKVPVGIYTCIRRKSPKFGYDVFLLQNVPGHSAIEIHRGNFNDDSDGCLLLGCGISQMNGFTMLTESEIAFDQFMKLQQGVNQFLLTITSTV